MIIAGTIQVCARDDLWGWVEQVQHPAPTGSLRGVRDEAIWRIDIDNLLFLYLLLRLSRLS